MDALCGLLILVRLNGTVSWRIITHKGDFLISIYVIQHCLSAAP